jgi:NADP-dependent 3-hydroxy acid dehydrogenase YdfG
MRRQEDGLIVNVASIAAKRVYAGAGVSYTASKHGLHGLSVAVAAEEGANGIRCTSLLPGLVNTELINNQAVTYTAEDRAVMMQPEDLAQVVRFLALLPARCKVPEIQIVPTRSQRPDKPPDDAMPYDLSRERAA